MCRAVVEGMRFVRQLNAARCASAASVDRSAAGRACCRAMPSSPITCVERLGPSRVRDLRDRRGRRTGCARQRVSRPPHDRSSRGRRLGVSADSGILHRLRGLHDCGESGRRDPCDAATDGIATRAAARVRLHEGSRMRLTTEGFRERSRRGFRQAGSTDSSRGHDYVD